jgi:hypothetical protein
VRNSLLGVVMPVDFLCAPARADDKVNTKAGVSAERPGRRREVINNSELQAKLLHCLLLPPRGFSLSSLGVKNLGEPCCAQRAASVDAASASSRNHNPDVTQKILQPAFALLCLMYFFCSRLWTRFFPVSGKNNTKNSSVSLRG